MAQVAPTSSHDEPPSQSMGSWPDKQLEAVETSRRGDNRQVAVDATATEATTHCCGLVEGQYIAPKKLPPTAEQLRVRCPPALHGMMTPQSLCLR